MLAFLLKYLYFYSILGNDMSCNVRKLTFWFSIRSNTNCPGCTATGADKRLKYLDLVIVLAMWQQADQRLCFRTAKGLFVFLMMWLVYHR